ncbi:MAG: hypothetical protein AAB225_24245, partial [Acidobacteriota bacterium]
MPVRLRDPEELRQELRLLREEETEYYSALLWRLPGRLSVLAARNPWVWIPLAPGLLGLIIRP